MDLMSMSRGPPDRSFGTHRAKKSSSTQPQTHRRSEVQTQPPASFVQGSPAATATGDRHAQPRTQTSTWGQPQQVSHGQTHQVPHGQTHQMPHGQTHQVPQRQVHQVSHGQPHQMSHGQTHQLPYGQTHVSQGQTSQPAQVQMPRATGGTSSYGQQRSADKPRKSDYMPAATAKANQRTTGGSSRR
ncbi:hypothetical protein BGY98DRAFT_572635 [Russula aff. rugulosa BPL654]|nr:hypothetical protein BGY98DRAFT_572635 [Russula aff. rugulosa BPL654]